MEKLEIEVETVDGFIDSSEGHHSCISPSFDIYSTKISLKEDKRLFLLPVLIRLDKGERVKINYSNSTGLNIINSLDILDESGEVKYQYIYD